MARTGEERRVYRVLVGKPEGRRPLGRPRRRWVDNIRTVLQEVGCGYMDWIGLAQDRERWRTVVSAVMNLRVPSNVGNFLTSCKPVSFSRRTLHHGVSKYVACDVHLGFGDKKLDVASETMVVLPVVTDQTKGHGMDVAEAYITHDRDEKFIHNIRWKT